MPNQEKYSFTFTHADVVFAGTICYSAKDWSFTLDKPIEKSHTGGHLTLMAPVRYTVLESDDNIKRINGVVNVNLLVKVKEECIEGYANGWQNGWN